MRVRELAVQKSTLLSDIRNGLLKHRTRNELVHLVRKLRWMGMETEAKSVQAQLAVSSAFPANPIFSDVAPNEFVRGKLSYSHRDGGDITKGTDGLLTDTCAQQALEQ